MLYCLCLGYNTAVEGGERMLRKLCIQLKRMIITGNSLLFLQGILTYMQPFIVQEKEEKGLDDGGLGEEGDFGGSYKSACIGI